MFAQRYNASNLEKTTDGAVVVLFMGTFRVAKKRHILLNIYQQNHRGEKQATNFLVMDLFVHRTVCKKNVEVGLK